MSVTVVLLVSDTLATGACSSEDLARNLQGFASGYTQTQAQIEHYHQINDPPVQRIIVQQYPPPLAPITPNVVKVTPVDQWGFAHP